MTKKDSTLIVVVLDRSGSMQSIASDTIGGFDKFVEDQRKDSPDDAKLTLIQFDDKYEEVYTAKPLAEVPSLVFHPRGMTALLDAMGRAITSTGESLATMAESDRPEAVVFVVITDGYENSSKEFNKAQIAEMVKHQEDTYNWQFVFLGANIDAIQAGGSIGVKGAMAMNYQANSQGVGKMYDVVSQNVKSYRTTKSASDLEFSDDQRKENN